MGEDADGPAPQPKIRSLAVILQIAGGLLAGVALAVGLYIASFQFQPEKKRPNLTDTSAPPTPTPGGNPSATASETGTHTLTTTVTVTQTETPTRTLSETPADTAALPEEPPTPTHEPEVAAAPPPLLLPTDFPAFSDAPPGSGQTSIGLETGPPPASVPEAPPSSLPVDSPDEGDMAPPNPPPPEAAPPVEQPPATAPAQDSAPPPEPPVSPAPPPVAPPQVPPTVPVSPQPPVSIPPEEAPPVGAQPGVSPEEVEKARSEAAAAQDFADSREAGKLAPAQYQEGQRIYGHGMDALKNERFSLALEKFTQSAGAFIEAASAAGRNRVEQMTRSQAKALLQQARELAAKRRIPEAEKSYILFLQQFPQDSMVSVEYGMLLMNNGAYVRGMQHLRKTLQLPGLLPAQRAQIHARFAEAYHQTGQIDFALVEITEAIRTEPGNSSYQKMLAQYQREAAQRRQAQPQRPPGAAPPGPIQDLTGSVLDRFLK